MLQAQKSKDNCKSASRPPFAQQAPPLPVAYRRIIPLFSRLWLWQLLHKSIVHNLLFSSTISAAISTGTLVLGVSTITIESGCAQPNEIKRTGHKKNQLVLTHVHVNVHAILLVRLRSTFSAFRWHYPQYIGPKHLHSSDLYSLRARLRQKKLRRCPDTTL